MACLLVLLAVALALSTAEEKYQYALDELWEQANWVHWERRRKEIRELMEKEARAAVAAWPSNSDRIAIE